MLRSLSRCFALTLATGFALLSAPAGAITFDDGQLHVIDAGNSYPFDVVAVDDDSHGTATTVSLVPGHHANRRGVDS
jgi:hypothetical protein